MIAPVFWDPALFARVRTLHLAARRLVAGGQAGSHLAVQRGHEAEFLGYQPYVPPHPLKDVDWRVYARNDRLVVRERRAERDFACLLIFDASADLGSTPAKWKQAIEVTAALAFAVLANGDPVGLRIGAGAGMTESLVPASRSRAQLGRILGALASVRPEGRADLVGLFAGIASPQGRSGVHSRTLLGVVSDFMEDPAEWSGALGVLARRGVDLRAVQVYDRDELTLSGDNPMRFYSAETGRRFPLDPAAVRGAFADVVRGWMAEVQSAFVREHAMCWALAAQDPAFSAVGAWLAGRPGASSAASVVAPS